MIYSILLFHSSTFFFFFWIVRSSTFENYWNSLIPFLIPSLDIFMKEKAFTFFLLLCEFMGATTYYIDPLWFPILIVITVNTKHKWIPLTPKIRLTPLWLQILMAPIMITDYQSLMDPVMTINMRQAHYWLLIFGGFHNFVTFGGFHDDCQPW